MKKFDREEVARTLLAAIHSIEDSMRAMKRVQEELSKDFDEDGAVLSYEDMTFVSLIAHTTINLENNVESLKLTYEGYLGTDDKTGQSEEES